MLFDNIVLQKTKKLLQDMGQQNERSLTDAKEKLKELEKDKSFKEYGRRYL